MSDAIVWSASQSQFSNKLAPVVQLFSILANIWAHLILQSLHTSTAGRVPYWGQVVNDTVSVKAWSLCWWSCTKRSPFGVRVHLQESDNRSSRNPGIKTTTHCLRLSCVFLHSTATCGWVTVVTQHWALSGVRNMTCSCVIVFCSRQLIESGY